MARRTSAGIVLYRRPPGAQADECQILLVHPGGPFWAKKHEHAWSIPKGEIDDGEDARDAAIREFEEELGSAVPDGPLIEMGIVSGKGAKKVLAWAVEGDLDASSITSGEFELEWPPRSGRMRSFPEVDRAEWVMLADAATHLHKGLLPVVDRMLAILSI